MKYLLLIASITTLIFSCSENSNQLKSQKPQALFDTKVDSLLSEYEKSGEFMGSICLSHNGEIIYTNAIGFDDIETKKKSVSSTKYRIGSVSKIYTAVLAFKAIEEDLLQLEQTIESYFPNLKNANKITIAHLLQHRSGVPNFTEDQDFFSYHTEYKSPQEMMALISELGSDFEPGSRGEYSNSNYFLLSQILEKVYNLTYPEVLKIKIIEPLNLINTYNGDRINVNNNEAYSYSYNNNWQKLSETDMSIALGAGSIVSNPSDITIFMDALFTGKIISPKSLEIMQTIENTYGMGLIRYTIADRKGFGHRGTIDGFKSTAMYFPEEKLGLAITSNASRDNINEIYTQVLKLYFDDTPVEASESEVVKFAGVYSSPSDKTDNFIFNKEKNHLILLVKGEFEHPLIYKGNNRFVFEQAYAESFSFTFSPDGKQVVVEQGDYEGIFIKE